MSRFGDDSRYRVAAAKLLATLTLTLPGTPYIYQGEEIGMTNVIFPDISDYNDIDMLNRYREKVAAGSSPEQVLAELRPLSRDNARTPMQWNNLPQAGFTSGQPWLKVNPNYIGINVAAAEEDPQSVLHYYRKMIRFRKDNPVIITGDYHCIDEDNSNIYAYLRASHSKTLLVVLNFSSDNQNFDILKIAIFGEMTFMMGNYDLLPCRKIFFFGEYYR